MEYKMIECRFCDGKMPELRLTKYGYNFCVECSEKGNKVKPKQAITVMMGEGDHTWIETTIVDGDQFHRYQNSERAREDMNRADKAELSSMDEFQSPQDTTIINMENGQ